MTTAEATRNLWLDFRCDTNATSPDLCHYRSDDWSRGSFKLSSLVHRGELDVLVFDSPWTAGNRQQRGEPYRGDESRGLSDVLNAIADRDYAGGKPLTQWSRIFRTESETGISPNVDIDLGLLVSFSLGAILLDERAEDADGMLEWDTFLTPPPPRARGKIRVRLKHAGQVTPRPVELPGDD